MMLIKLIAESALYRTIYRSDIAGFGLVPVIAYFLGDLPAQSISTSDIQDNKLSLLYLADVR